jgi:hypothetical protein
MQIPRNTKVLDSGLEPVPESEKFPATVAVICFLFLGMQMA